MPNPEYQIDQAAIYAAETKKTAFESYVKLAESMLVRSCRCARIRVFPET